ncbi:hypothetical protein OG555_09800 [Kribbella sp. NBC_01484]|uniref:hypothetical protein n=1 Tax=Kribbella sp. NBC_01484 TaxID=2903579 RepID=UPI002E33156A|nr:hypothetical protein [Kribbella sp. NBC_01484]
MKRPNPPYAGVRVYVVPINQQSSAGGAIAGQVVSAIFTGVREEKRLRWEGEQRAWERRQVVESECGSDSVD